MQSLQEFEMTCICRLMLKRPAALQTTEGETMAVTMTSCIVDVLEAWGSADFHARFMMQQRPVQRTSLLLKPRSEDGFPARCMMHEVRRQLQHETCNIFSLLANCRV